MLHTVHTCILSSHFVLCRRSEVLPAGAARAVDDVRAVQRLDPGIQVCIYISGDSLFRFSHVQPRFKCRLCRSAAFKIKTRDCRLCWTPVRNCPRPTTTTSSESLFFLCFLTGSCFIQDTSNWFLTNFRLSSFVHSSVFVRKPQITSQALLFLSCVAAIRQVSLVLLILRDMEAGFLGLQLWVALMPQWNLFYSWGNHLNHVWWNKDLP